MLSYPIVARARIAAEGIRGLSLRAVAQHAGMTLGTLSYRVGDKAALIAGLIDHEVAERRMAHARWLERAARLDVASPPVLAELILAYLDEAASIRREAAIAGCELLLEAGIDPESYRGIAALFEAEQAFWTALLAGRHLAAAELGAAIAGYCHDELPFSIAIGPDPDYRLLRAATVSRLAAGLAGQADGVARHFDALVAALSGAAARASIPVDLPPNSKKAALARVIAELITEQGVAAITHRLVAVRAGIPNSSVAHHFRTRDDLLRAGIAALIQAMRGDLAAASGRPNGASSSGFALLRTTHALALAATRDPELIPFAVDMRRRRAENVRTMVAESIAGAEGLDGAAVQAAVMVMVGCGLAAQAEGNANGLGAPAFSSLVRLRAICGTQ